MYRFFFNKYHKDWRYEYYKVKEIYILPFNKKTQSKLTAK